MAKQGTPEYYENLVSVRNIIYDDVTRALAIVKNYIIEHDLILVGGMAIDFAMKLKGDRIYTDDQLPDYDFYSPDHTMHAYELGAMLCKEGFSNISCIQAAHITTMRVRVDYETVADITYCPPDIYEKIPTLKYDNLRILHPHYQMIDQHSALSMPFTQSGPELVIFHRWKKDMVRYDKLYAHYPVVPVRPDVPVSDTGNTLDIGIMQKTKYATRGATLPAHGYVRPYLREIAAKSLELPTSILKIKLSDISNSCICGWGAIDYVVSDDGEYISMFIPEGELLSVASDDYKQFIIDNGLTNVTYYSEYFGKMPRRVVCSSNIKNHTTGNIIKIEVFDTYGTKISAKKISDRYASYVCNTQWSMAYLLVKIFIGASPAIVFTAEERYLRCRRLVIEGDYPSIDVYGTHSFTHSFLNRRKTDKARIYNIKSLDMQPKNMFPKYPLCMNDKSFDHTSSEYFKTDNRLLDEFHEWTLDPFPDYTTTSIKTSVA